MNKQHYTTIEQSKHLLELGLNPESADMYYILVGDIDSGNVISSQDICPIEVGKPYNNMTLAAWSVGALLEVMSKIDDGISDCLPNMSKYYTREGKTEYTCAYIRETLPACAIQHLIADSPIEAAYEMICWLLENNYLNKK